MTKMSIEITIICFIIGSIFPLQTTSTPIEISQVVGRTASLNCSKSSSDEIIWKFNDEITFHDGIEFKGVFKGRSRFENDLATGTEFLKISNIKPEDAGLYTCLIASPEKLLQSTQLTVLDSEPTFDSNKKDNEFVGNNTCSNTSGLNQDYMRFSCAVSYHGTKAPRLQWEDVKNNQILKDVKCDGSQSNRTNCTLTLKAEPQYDGSTFRCKVVTSREQYNCSTKVIKVHYFIQKNDLSSSETINDKISNSFRTNQKTHHDCEFEKNEDLVGPYTNNMRLYRCTYFYNIKNTKCSTVLTGVIEPELSWNLKSLTIVNCLVLFVFAIVSYYLLVNERVKSTLENLGKIFVTWSKVSLLVFAVLDFALLMLILANPTENFLNVKYAHTVALLLVACVEALLLLSFKYKDVSPCIVGIILCLIVLCDVFFLIAAAAIVTKELWKSSNGTIDEWVICFIFTLVIFAFFIPPAVVIARRCCKSTKKWAPLKRNILSALKLHGALNDSDYKKILLQNDEDKALSMLIDAIQRGSEEDDGIFRMVVKEIAEIDIDNVEKKDPKTGDFELRTLLSGGRITEGRAAEHV